MPFLAVGALSDQDRPTMEYVYTTRRGNKDGLWEKVVKESMLNLL